MSEEKFFIALEICDKIDFFQGQRAGRELWFSKPVEVQNEDLRNFGENIAFIKDVINCQQEEIDRLTIEKERLIKFSKEGIDRWKKDFIRHFTRTLKQRIEDLGNLAMSEYHSVEIEIDDIAKEMVGDGNA